MAELSSRLSKPVYVEVYRLPSTSNYVVIAYTSDRGFKEAYNSTVKNKHEDKVLSSWCDVLGTSSYLLALKSRCEFLEILEKNDAILLLPYRFHRGIRQFDALIPSCKVDLLAKDLYDYYGRRFVRISKIRSLELAKRLYSNISKVEGVLSRLTDRELLVLRRAVSEGYFEIPRRITLEELGKSLNLSKVTVETHLRKVIRKLVYSILSPDLI